LGEASVRLYGIGTRGFGYYRKKKGKGVGKKIDKHTDLELREDEGKNLQKLRIYLGRGELANLRN